MDRKYWNGFAGGLSFSLDYGRNCPKAGGGTSEVFPSAGKYFL
jgi:hypothetical protein